MTEGVEIFNRYSALGIVPPSPWTTCRGPCEGIGLYPMTFAEWEGSGPERPPVVPQQDEDGRWEPWPPPDGWVFVYCRECSGTGRRIPGRIGDALDVLHAYACPFLFVRHRLRHKFEDESRLDALRSLPGAFAWAWREQAERRRLLRREARGR